MVPTFSSASQSFHVKPSTKQSATTPLAASRIHSTQRQTVREVDSYTHAIERIDDSIVHVVAD